MSIPLATRVRDLNTQRLGMVSGRMEPGVGTSSLVPVILEGSTRCELWPLHRLEPLPRHQQLTALGGTVHATRGYPLMPPIDP
jgi:hypothetical protein